LSSILISHLRRWIPTLALLFLLAASPAPAGPVTDPDLVGQWTEPIDIPTVGVHATLLRTGEVMLFGYPHRNGTFKVTLWDSVTHESDVIQVPRRRDFFCAGHTVLPSGEVFVAGGTGHDDPEFWGAKGTDVFDPETREWKAGPSMDMRRWYPSTVVLPNNKTLIFSGRRFPEHVKEDTFVRRVESYNSETGKLDTLPQSANKRLDLYPRFHVTPSGDLFHAGPEGRSHFFDPQADAWSKADDMAIDRRHNGTSVQLPGLDRIMALAGRADSGVTETAEIIDLGEPDPQWTATTSMEHARVHANVVLLADGSVLVVGGGQLGHYRQPVDVPELFDPETETWETMSPQGTGRMYHSTALLLPDGRVMSAGQDSGPFEDTLQIFSPPYLFAGERPDIAHARTHLEYGEEFSVQLSQASSIDRVALVRPGSVTHSVNFDQRYVDLDFAESSPDEVQATTPTSTSDAPAGWYMLFVTNDAGIPSVAKWVRLHR
jgi:galactose oxidase